MRRLAVASAALSILVSACAPSDDRYDVGYDDGMAVGYNTACEIRTTMIDGDFANRDYARGYAEGMEAGIAACNADRRAGRI